MRSYLTSIDKQFRYYKSLGEKTFDQLTFEETQKAVDQVSNSVSIIVKHLVGNMLSRWTNFRNEDGEKQWRNRDDEFIDDYTSKNDLIKHWEKGWTCLFKALDQLSDTDLEDIVYIRNQGHTIVEAINRQMMHYAYHIGQIVFIGKMIKGDTWTSLSIPKGKSGEYNAEKFKRYKGNRHFTEDV